MNTKKPNTLFQFLIIGLIYCFVLKNFISIVNGSYGGDPTYIISNPSIDEELWYIIGITYLLTVKVFFEDFFRNVVSQIKTYKTLNIIIEKYHHFSKSRFFGALVVIVFFILGLISIAFTIIITNNNSLIFKINWIMILYITFLFNKNYRVIVL